LCCAHDHAGRRSAITNAPQLTGRYGDSIYCAVPIKISVALIETMRRVASRRVASLR
jgi:hypothetical protein